MKTLKNAVLSKDSLYRYELRRAWGEGPPVCWVMLNPSTADALEDDPTIRRCISFTDTWGYTNLVVVNLFARRATKPERLFDAVDPIGPENFEHIQKAINESVYVVAAWGAFYDREQASRSPRLGSRIAVERLCQIAGKKLYSLGVTDKGAPRHPLYLPADTPLQAYGL